MKNITKRGQVNTIAPAVLLLVFASVVLVFGLIILQDIRDTPIVAQGYTDTKGNESLGPTTTAGLSGNVTEAGSQIVEGNSPGFTGFSVTNVDAFSLHTNSTISGLNTGNYTTNASGYIFWAGDGTTLEEFNNTQWWINYTWTEWGGAASDGNLTIAGLGTFADFWEIIVLAIVISVVIGLLLVVFGRQGRR